MPLTYSVMSTIRLYLTLDAVLVNQWYRFCQGGAKVVGIDISPDLIAIAKRRLYRYGVSAEVRVGSTYETGLPEKSIDVVFCVSLLHHLEIHQAKQEICRILRPGGRFIVKEPVRFSWTVKQLRRLFPAKQDISGFEYPLSFRQVELLRKGFIWARDARLLRRHPIRHFATPMVMLS
jgi:SAM-dependent methyltransferase